MASKFVYKIRNKKTGHYYRGYSGFSAEGKEFKTEINAKSALNYFVSSTINRKFFLDKTTNKFAEKDLADMFPYDLEIVKHEIVYQERGIVEVANAVKDVIIRRKLQDKSYSFGYFWDNAQKKGYADKIEYIVRLDIPPGTDRHKGVKEARAQLRLLGVMTRTFREYNGMFGFYNRDQAFKAKLTLNAKEFIDMTELKKELFG